MRPPIRLRPLTEDERARSEAGLRSKDAFVLRRCQIVLGYRGMAKTHLQHLNTAAAINLFGALNWLNEVLRLATPLSHFARLAA